MCMKKKNKVLIGTIILAGILLGIGLLGWKLFMQDSTSVSRNLNRDMNLENQKNLEDDEDKSDQEDVDDKEATSNHKESNKEAVSSTDNPTKKSDELREIFGEEVFETKEYYVDDEETAREIIRLQGEAFRTEASEDSEVREIEKRIEKNCEIEAVNLQDLDLEMAQYIEVACEYMYDRYPCLKGFLTNISVQENISESTGVIALYDTDTFLSTSEGDDVYPFTVKRQILLDQEDFYKPQRIKNIIKRSVREGHWRENTSVKSIFVHELTHCLIDCLVCETHGLGKSICITEENGDAFGECVTQGLAINQTMEKDICNTAYENYKTEQETECTYEEFCTEISLYAIGTQEDGGISYGETIAEAMTDVYINGADCNPASQAIIDELERRLKKLNLEVKSSK